MDGSQHRLVPAGGGVRQAVPAPELLSGDKTAGFGSGLRSSLASRPPVGLPKKTKVFLQELPRDLHTALPPHGTREAAAGLSRGFASQARLALTLLYPHLPGVRATRAPGHEVSQGPGPRTTLLPHRVAALSTQPWRLCWASHWASREHSQHHLAGSDWDQKRKPVPAERGPELRSSGSEMPDRGGGGLRCSPQGFPGVPSRWGESSVALGRLFDDH